MADLIRVTVAPGCHVTVSPHPSGIPGMAPLVLHGGNTLDVTPKRAADLLRAALIRDPVTGAVPPLPEAASGMPSISYNGRPFEVAGTQMVHPSWAETAAPFEPKIMAPPDRTVGNPSVTYTDDPNGPSVTQADGRTWPTF